MNKSRINCFLLTLLAGPTVVQAAQEIAKPAVVETPAVEEYSSTHRVGCVAELQGYHYNLKELSMPIDP